MLFFHHILGPVLVSGLFVRHTAAADHFTNPPDGITDLTYTRGSLIQITWQSDLPFVALTLWHSGGSDYEYLHDSVNVTNTGRYPWNVGTTADISTNSFNFLIYKPGETGSRLSSNRFRIIEPSASAGASTSASTASASTAINSASSTSVTSSTSLSASTFMTSTSPTPVSRSTTQSPNIGSSTVVATNSGLSQSAKTGLGVGIGIGIPLLFAIGIFLGWKFRGGRITSNNPRYEHPAAVDMPPNVGGARFQPALQEPSMPKTNTLSDSHLTPHELSESRLNELNSTTIHQME